MVSVPYRPAGVTQVLTTLPLSLFEIRRSAITPSTALHAFAPACSLRRTSLSLSLSPSSRLRTLLLLCTRKCSPESVSSLKLDVQLFPLVAYVQHFRLPWFIFSPCQVNSPFYSSSVSCSSCLPFATTPRLHRGVSSWPPHGPQPSSLTLLSAIDRSVAITISLGTVSKAFSKSMNPRAILLCNSSVFSTICLRTYITSAVPLPFLNHCCSPEVTFYSFPDPCV